MNFLVTGATGFLGVHLTYLLLKEGHDVFATYRHKYHKDFNNLEGLNLVKFDVYEDLLDNGSFDGVFHLAAETHPPTSFSAPYHFFKVNSMGTIKLCRQIEQRIHNAVFMYCSTSEVYGVWPEDYLITEETPLKPMNPYAVSKAAADMYVQEATRNNRLKGFITRAFSHTGPYRGSNYSISSDAIQIAKIIKGQQDPIIKVGNLKSKRVVMDVREVADVYYQLMIKYLSGEMKDGEIFNICGDGLHEIGYFLDLMLDLYNIKHIVSFEIDEKLYRPIDIPVQNPDSSKVRSFLNWKPSIPIEKTLKDLVEYWLERV